MTYFPDAGSSTLPVRVAEEYARDSSSCQSPATIFQHLGPVRWNQVILGTLLGPVQFSDDDGGDDSDKNGNDDLGEEPAVL